MADWKIIEGKVENVCESLDIEADAVFCDPPYGLGDPIYGEDMEDLLEDWMKGDEGKQKDRSGFMGSDWDKVIPPGHWKSIKSSVKPGAFLASFGGSRTFDLQCMAQRLAGWRMRDEALSLCWAYGSGFPKSKNVGKAIDDTKGADREVVGPYRTPEGNKKLDTTNNWGENGRRQPMVTAPSTPEAEKWEGYGTNLSPAHEPIGLFRKPTDLTFAESALQNGCGSLNIDGCRTPVEGKDRGRWPANLVICHHPLCGREECHPQCHVIQMDEQSGTLSSGGSISSDVPSDDGFGGSVYGDNMDQIEWEGYEDSGGASRYFPRFRYNSKAQKNEKEAGLFGEGKQNDHPTVKPVELCRWVSNLLLPPERGEDSDPRTLLVPFSGSGSEVIGASLAGWDRIIGIEMKSEYVELSRERIEWWETYGEDAIDVHKGEVKRQEHNKKSDSPDLFDEVFENEK